MKPTIGQRLKLDAENFNQIVQAIDEILTRLYARHPRPWRCVANETEYPARDSVYLVDRDGGILGQVPGLDMQSWDVAEHICYVINMDGRKGKGKL